jgi:hypothetical protein
MHDPLFDWQDHGDQAEDTDPDPSAEEDLLADLSPFLSEDADPIETAQYLDETADGMPLPPLVEAADPQWHGHAEETAHLAHAQDHQSGLTFGGYSHCTCGCSGFVGSGAQCTNCGHSFSQHFR